MAEGASPQLAQINVARPLHPAHDPRLDEFTGAIARITALAKRSPGFVWQYETADGHFPTSDLLGDPPVIFNLSVWATYQDLHDFTYRSRHGHYLRRRAQWFAPLPPPATALWWVPEGRRPTVEEAVARLGHLRRHGPTPQAFTVRRRFTADGRPDVPQESGRAGAAGP
ncbi:DUF3291 domain-containing protein [Microbispora sp. ATCC PTA-5024]|uniref:DUF3291 domain-containing protein n=1 Tax=Microbispora sp. ATCC PTA-5024 TaxID=316330 RepID=UPI0003DCB5A8|nr:DUF3291 domain-containing protein [Microbispora sp. ATCC PTA-5024]ETK33703.1 hypothetical protein MPTA5024_23145 [Microbispora sp. ATCC PTA-5024]